MASANDRQEGGSHYKAGSIQHWDLIAQNRVGYLEGNATKYLTRWRKKNGLEDLKKSLHYVDKLTELVAAGILTNQSSFMDRNHLSYDDLERFYIENDVESAEQLAIFWLLTWDCLQDIQHVRTIICHLIEKASGHETAPGAH